MQSYQQMNEAELKSIYSELLGQYEGYVARGLKLDLSRGKPNAEQLDISQALLSTPLEREECVLGGLDLRNYGILDGLPEMKKFFGKLLGINPDNIIVGGNSSLQLMYDTLMRAMVFGVVDSKRPWSQEEKIKWICVTPGYDRHFKITETLGFELISVKMTESGPDMDEVERLVLDPTVKGIWCVPKYSNPTGNTYSDDTVRRLASMKCAAPDFRIMWDNAYAVHDLTENGDRLLDILSEAEKAGNPNRVFYFASTSKVTFPGGGVAMMASGAENVANTKKHLGIQTIGFDKINQLRHLKYFGDADRVHTHMMSLAVLIKEKFDITLKALSGLRGIGIAEWTEPRGGYFVSLDVLPGTAKRVYNLMKNAGVTLTSVGATYPYGIDPEDKNLRIAPTYPSNDDLALACEVLICAVKLAALEKLLGL